MEQPVPLFDTGRTSLLRTPIGLWQSFPTKKWGEVDMGLPGDAETGRGFREVPTDRFFQYWGKAQPGAEGARYHLLPYHCLDVAAVGRVLLQQHPRLCHTLAGLLQLDEHDFVPWQTFFLALHDIGKFASAFQNLRPDVLRHMQGRTDSRVYSVHHDSLGFLFWAINLSNTARDEDWLGLKLHAASDKDRWAGLLEDWVRTVTGHHGTPPRIANVNLRHHATAQDSAAAVSFARAVRSLLLSDQSAGHIPNIKVAQRAMHIASWYLAGLAVLCDWIGSNQRHFKYRDRPVSLSDYWLECALPAAAIAVREAGILPSAANQKATFQVLFPAIPTPSPLQRYAATVELSGQPEMYLLEDVTGSGKTEAALLLAQRIMAAGSAEGVFLALPTMATANAMYQRLQQSYRRLFDPRATPSLVLSHSARDLVPEFRQSILPHDPESQPTYHADDETATAQCTAWLADSRKKALLADVGVGTIDQALLGVLPSRHQSLRLLGLVRKVLIVDEVHAYDPYMQALLHNLLQFHAALGGSAILLSATLPLSMRTALTNAYRRGLGAPAVTLAGQDYPLATRARRDAAEESALETRDEVRREVRVRLLDDEAEVEGYLIACAAQNQCVCWVRNTVADAVDAYRRLHARLGAESAQAKLTLFHARFAMGDRLDKEAEVRSYFGKHSMADDRKGRILIATQVVEQSLDLDFDVMVSDLAPIELLMQRAGRLHRHVRDQSGNPLPDGNIDHRDTPCLVVHSPPPVGQPGQDWYRAVFPKGSRVYPNHAQLWLTARLLAQRGGWRQPEHARALIEGVYGEDSEAIPPALAAHACGAEGDRQAERDLGKLNGLRLDEGYAATPRQWLEDTRTPTRLGEQTTTVRLARWDGRKICPWYPADEHAWDLSQVSVRQAVVSSEHVRQDAPWQEATEVLKNELPDRGKWSVLVVLTELTAGIYRGAALDADSQPVEVRYNQDEGLLY